MTKMDVLSSNIIPSSLIQNSKSHPQTSKLHLTPTSQEAYTQPLEAQLELKMDNTRN